MLEAVRGHLHFVYKIQVARILSYTEYRLRMLNVQAKQRKGEVETAGSASKAGMCT